MLMFILMSLPPVKYVTATRLPRKLLVLVVRQSEGASPAGWSSAGSNT
jgi:hypothetical protein